MSGLPPDVAALLAAVVGALDIAQAAADLTQWTAGVPVTYTVWEPGRPVGGGG